MSSSMFLWVYDCVDIDYLAGTINIERFPSIEEEIPSKAYLYSHLADRIFQLQEFTEGLFGSLMFTY